MKSSVQAIFDFKPVFTRLLPGQRGISGDSEPQLVFSPKNLSESTAWEQFWTPALRRCRFGIGQGMEQSLSSQQVGAAWCIFPVLRVPHPTEARTQWHLNPPLSRDGAVFPLLLSKSGGFFLPWTRHSASSLSLILTPTPPAMWPLCFPPLALLLTGVQPFLELPSLGFPRGFRAGRDSGTAEPHQAAEHFQVKLKVYFSAFRHCTSSCTGP